MLQLYSPIVSQRLLEPDFSIPFQTITFTVGIVGYLWINLWRIYKIDGEKTKRSWCINNYHHNLYLPILSSVIYTSSLSICKYSFRLYYIINNEKIGIKGFAFRLRHQPIWSYQSTRNPWLQCYSIIFAVQIPKGQRTASKETALDQARIDIPDYPAGGR